MIDMEEQKREVRVLNFEKEEEMSFVLATIAIVRKSELQHIFLIYNTGRLRNNHIGWTVLN
jgi:hypothetical protein